MNATLTNFFQTLKNEESKAYCDYFYNALLVNGEWLINIDYAQEFCQKRGMDVKKLWEDNDNIREIKHFIKDDREKQIKKKLEDNKICRQFLNFTGDGRIDYDVRVDEFCKHVANSYEPDFTEEEIKDALDDKDNALLTFECLELKDQLPE